MEAIIFSTVSAETYVVSYTYNFIDDGIFISRTIIDYSILTVPTLALFEFKELRFNLNLQRVCLSVARFLSAQF